MNVIEEQRSYQKGKNCPLKDQIKIQSLVKIYFLVFRITKDLTYEKFRWVFVNKCIIYKRFYQITKLNEKKNTVRL